MSKFKPTQEQVEAFLREVEGPKQFTAEMNKTADAFLAMGRGDVPMDEAEFKRLAERFNTLRDAQRREGRATMERLRQAFGEDFWAEFIQSVKDERDA